MWCFLIVDYLCNRRPIWHHVALPRRIQDINRLISPCHLKSSRLDWSSRGQKKKLSTLSPPFYLFSQRYKKKINKNAQHQVARFSNFNNSITYKLIQVWVSLGISVVVMTLTITFLSGFYRKYFERTGNNSSPSPRLMNFSSLGRTAIHVGVNTLYFDQFVGWHSNSRPCGLYLPG